MSRFTRPSAPVPLRSDGIEEICVVLSEARGSDQEVLERITHAFRRLQIGKSYVIRTGRIPCDANGKFQRELLKKLAAESVRDR